MARDRPGKGVPLRARRRPQHRHRRLVARRRERPVERASDGVQRGGVGEARPRVRGGRDVEVRRARRGPHRHRRDGHQRRGGHAGGVGVGLRVWILRPRPWEPHRGGTGEADLVSARGEAGGDWEEKVGVGGGAGVGAGAGHREAVDAAHHRDRAVHRGGRHRGRVHRASLHGGGGSAPRAQAEETEEERGEPRPQGGEKAGEARAQVRRLWHRQVAASAAG
mmetsp:Transcript_13654/g.57799  ORF Transcript_13654/g.57799 Transcript_13654/m.57799 type:complete len:222 (+) Transcript_13654:908-1573(+)